MNLTLENATLPVICWDSATRTGTNGSWDVYRIRVIKAKSCTGYNGQLWINGRELKGAGLFTNNETPAGKSSLVAELTRRAEALERAYRA